MKIRRIVARMLLLAIPSAGALAGARFVDATAASGIDFRMTSGGTPSRYILEVNGGGVALFDYDRDGDLDVFLANGATLARPERGPGSRLYANAGDGTFRDVTREVGISLRRWAMGVAVGDVDGDGDEDLYVTCYGPNVLLRNDVASDGRFVDVTAEAGVGDERWGTSAAFGDLDADGDLDLYVANYLEFDTAAPPERKGMMFLGVPVMAGPAGLAPQQDVLYENLGRGRFRDVTAASGCRRKQPGYGLGVMIFDANRDGRLDIFVGNDSTQNFLFENRGGMKFVDKGVVSGIASNYDGGNQATMGIALGDVDDNGFPDVFTTNFSSDTNTLHLNLEGKWFDDRTSQYGLAMVSRPFLSWATSFQDFDFDGDLDLFIASGHVYPETATRKMDSEYEQPLLLFERQGQRFVRSTGAGEPFERKYSARSAALGDLDGDGDVDIVLTTLNGKVSVLRNDSPRREAIVVALRDRRGSAAVHGAVVELLGGTAVQRRWLGGGSYQSADATVAYFGWPAGPEARPRVRVVWPDGATAEHAVRPGSRATITAGSDAPQFEPLRR